jgi:predicted GNAT family acetyltransferase
MKVELIESVDEFIAASADFRAADPLRTNIMGSVALSIAKGDRTYEAYHWWIVRDGDGDVIGIAMRTSPMNMVISSMSAEAARSLGRSVGQFDDDLPGLLGSANVIEAFAQGYVASKSPGSARSLVPHRGDLLYELEELVEPSVEGIGRVAREEETELLARMFVEFTEEAAVPRMSLADARENVSTRTRDQALFCWEVDGVVVSVAGHAPIVTTGEIVIGRVGPVYTPPSYRRHGYGSAVTAVVTRHLIEKGARVMLFTDPSNPTSNAIYQALGYRLIDELVEMSFED